MKPIVMLMYVIVGVVTDVHADVVRWDINANPTGVHADVSGWSVGTTTGKGMVAGDLTGLACADFPYVAEASENKASLAGAEPVKNHGLVFDADTCSRYAVQWGALGLLVFGSLAVVERYRRQRTDVTGDVKERVRQS